MRQISRVADLMLFQRFLRLMAARVGQLLNLNAVANDLGVAQTTARDWLAVLEASYIAFRLPPYHTNFGKRLVKTEMKSGATFQEHWPRAIHTWERHAANARRGTAMLISSAPGNYRYAGLMAAHWRDALMALAPQGGRT